MPLPLSCWLRATRGVGCTVTCAARASSQAVIEPGQPALRWQDLSGRWAGLQHVCGLGQDLRRAENEKNDSSYFEGC